MGSGEPAEPGAARFDHPDRSFVLVGLTGVSSAAWAEAVPTALRWAEEAAREGYWVAGFVAYEAAPGLDASLTVRVPHAGSLPLAWFGAWERCVAAQRPVVCRTMATEWSLHTDRIGYRTAVEAIRELIAAGDVYQVNFTARATAAVADSATLYAELLEAQGPTAYGALISTGEHAVVCASPELFFEMDGKVVTAEPMKGTARRGRSVEEDRRRATQLTTSVKDRAENVMIVDLVRNDLGRVGVTGTVQVPSLFDVRPLPTVWQMTSTVRAVLRDDAGLVDVFGALFPSGSVTGAPKRAAMRYIKQLEEEPRGVYCGAVGFLGPGARRARFAVGIRTVTVDLRSQWAAYGTGCGITWESDAGAEWDELLAKTAVLGGPTGPREPWRHPRG